MKIATIINYCTHDYRYLNRAIQEAKEFSHQIIVPVCDHFFNGEIENRSLLNRTYADHPDVQFVEFAFDTEHSYGLFRSIEPDHPDWIHYWHSTARYVGFHEVKEEIDYVLFLDVDEIVDGKRFSSWLEAFDVTPLNALRFYVYLYFREARFRAKTWSENILFVKRSSLEVESLLDPIERKGVFLSLPPPKRRFIVGLDDKPLFHHYSWVKTQDEMHAKARRWGHHADNNWSERIDREFESSFRGRDSLVGFKYEEVTPHFDPLEVKIEPLQEKFAFDHVKKVDRESLKRKTILLDV